MRLSAASILLMLLLRDVVAIKSRTSDDHVDRAHAIMAKVQYVHSSVIISLIALGSALSAIIYTHAQGTAATTGCVNLFECVGVPAVLGAIEVALLLSCVLYFIPALGSGGTKLGRYYQMIAYIGLAIELGVLTFAIFRLSFGQVNRPTGLALSFFVSMTFVLTVLFQAFDAFAVGDWQPSLISGPQASISKSMMHLGGFAMSVLCITVLSSMSVVAEVFVVENDSLYSWGRGVRVILSAIGSMLLFMTSLMPVDGRGIVANVEEKNKWTKRHHIFAGCSMAFMSLYTVIQTADACSKPEGRAAYCDSGLQYLGVTLMGIGNVVVLISLGLYMYAIKTKTEQPPLQSFLFALGEYLLVMSAPFASILRFRYEDFNNTKLALVAWNNPVAAK